MNIKFKLDASKLKDALEIVSIVQPRPVNAQGAAGYLFVVRGEMLSIYSQDSMHTTRAQVALIEVDGEGAFIYPSASIEPFKYLDGEEITFTAKDDNGQYVVSYSTSSGDDREMIAFDPKLMASLDKELEEAAEGRDFSVEILRDAIALSKNFLAKADDEKAEDNFKTLQIFDESKPEWEKGKGTLFASNARQAFYFYSDAFAAANLGLAVHGKHLSHLMNFLSKVKGKVTFKTNRNKIFALSEEPAPTPVVKEGETPPEPRPGRTHVIGWTHHLKTHGKFSYYGLKTDQWVLRVNRDKILAVLRYTKATLNKDAKKIRLSWSAAEKSLRFYVNESKDKGRTRPVQIDDNMIVLSEPRDIAFNVNIDNMISLFDGAKAEEVELRIHVRPADEKQSKERAMFRTIDTYLVDSDNRLAVGAGGEKKPEGTYECRVTRFTPSMD